MERTHKSQIENMEKSHDTRRGELVNSTQKEHDRDRCVCDVTTVLCACCVFVASLTNKPVCCFQLYEVGHRVPADDDDMVQ